MLLNRRNTSILALLGTLLNVESLVIQHHPPSSAAVAHQYYLPQADHHHSSHEFPRHGFSSNVMSVLKQHPDLHSPLSPDGHHHEPTVILTPEEMMEATSDENESKVFILKQQHADVIQRHKEQFDIEDDEEMDMLLHWFVLHDLDNDGRLDGNELLHAFTEWAQETYWEMREHADVEEYHEKSVLEIATELADHVIFEDDHDNDGFIGVAEFLTSQHH